MKILAISKRKLLGVFALAAAGLIGYGALQVVSPTTGKWEGIWIEETDLGPLKSNITLTAYPNGSIRGTLSTRDGSAKVEFTGSLDSSGNLRITRAPETTTALWHDVRVDLEGQAKVQRNQLQSNLAIVYPTAQQLQEWGVRSDEVIVSDNTLCIPELGLCFPLKTDWRTVEISLRKIY